MNSDEIEYLNNKIRKMKLEFEGERAFRRKACSERDQVQEMIDSLRRQEKVTKEKEYLEKILLVDDHSSVEEPKLAQKEPIVLHIAQRVDEQGESKGRYLHGDDQGALGAFSVGAQVVLVEYNPRSDSDD